MKDSDAIKFKEGCAAISKEATEQEFLPGGLGGFPTALPPEHRWKLCLFKGPVKKKMPHPSTAVSELDEQTRLQGARRGVSPTGVS